MPASISTLQIADSDKRNFITAIIWSETENLSGEFDISIFYSGHGDRFDLVIKPPKGEAITKQLYAKQGDLTPAIFRACFHELLKILDRSDFRSGLRVPFRLSSKILRA
jgi:hypothetical protein